MRFSLLVVFVLAVGLVGTLKWNLSTDEANEVASVTNPSEPNLSNSPHPLAVSPNLNQYLSTQAPNPYALIADQSKSVSVDLHAGHDHGKDSSGENLAADLNNFPVSMQFQIVSLSNRAETTIQPIEVKPGVFKIPNGFSPRVVPVAVINEDGSVSTYEY